MVEVGMINCKDFQFKDYVLSFKAEVRRFDGDYIEFLCFDDFDVKDWSDTDELSEEEMEELKQKITELDVDYWEV
jgi:hypothetical protein